MKKLPENKHPILSVIILNYNSDNYLYKCLKSLDDSQTNYYFETIVVDNNSSDNSIEVSKQVNIPGIKYLLLSDNKGFASGNNQGVKISNPNSKYVLFLNPDTTVEKNTIDKIIDYMESNTNVDASTCYIKFAKTQSMQPECHRGFPTPGNAFWHFFGFGIPKLFPKSKALNGYFQSYQNMKVPHQIDACVGAFLLVKRKVGQDIGWWNEKYFFYGEDLDFCYKLKEKSYKLFFYPDCQITHFQGISSGILSHSTKMSKANKGTKIKAAMASTDAMLIFYKENLINKYPKIIYLFVLAGVNFLKIKRLLKVKLS